MTLRRRPYRLFLGFLAMLLCAVCASPAGAAASSFIVRNVRVFDGEKIIPANSVVVVDGKIAQVGTKLKAPPGAEVIDGTGDTLLPGLIDSHVHLWTRDVLRLGLAMGATTQLDMYMRWNEAQLWKEQESKGAVDISDFRTAGTCFAVARGHGTESTMPPIVPISIPGQAQAFVNERIQHGSDYIKVMYDNGPRFAAMSKDILDAIVKAAHQRGKIVVVHAFSPQAILDVINSGADGLAHVPIVKLPEPQFTDALKSHHIFAITTLSITDLWFGTRRLPTTLPQDPFLAPYIDPFLRSSLEQPAFTSPEHIDYRDNQADLRILRDAGVPLLAGTDASNTEPAGALLHTELQLMVEAGLTPSQALTDATSVPAGIFGLTDRGRIVPGLRADLLLVRGNPTSDIRKTREIVAIWKQGVRVNRDTLRDEVAKEDTAWRFGAGWLPLAADNAKVRISNAGGGTNHAPRSLIINGAVENAHPPAEAGVVYLPSLAYPGATMDVSGVRQLSFRARGDGKTYTITVSSYDDAPIAKNFVAAKDWTLITFPFSDFDSSGKEVHSVRIASTTPGPFNLELADPQIGAHRWLGIEFTDDPSAAKISVVDPNSPGQRAGFKPGDTITRFNDGVVFGSDDLSILLDNTHVGDRVPVEIERGGDTKKLVIEVGQHASD
ncbi:MAG: amidohydrolase family protein [Candidatus Binataceae bacterium]